MFQWEQISVLIQGKGSNWFTESEEVPEDSRQGINNILDVMGKMGWQLAIYHYEPNLTQSGNNFYDVIFQRETNKKALSREQIAAGQTKLTKEAQKPMLQPAIEKVKRDLEEKLEKLTEEADKWDRDSHHFDSPLHQAVANTEFINAIDEQIGLAAYLERTGKQVIFYKNDKKVWLFGPGNVNRTLAAWIEIDNGTYSAPAGFTKSNGTNHGFIVTDISLQSQWDHGWSHDVIREIAKLTRTDIVKKILGAI